MGDKIDKLKAELTRLGVEYDFTDRLHEVPSYQSVTWWFNTADKARFFEYHDGSTRLAVHSSKCGVTPEEAIAATLGPCNCTNDCTNSERTGTCPSCGCVLYADEMCCPDCNAKVVDE